MAGLMMRNRSTPVWKRMRQVVASTLLLLCATTAIAPHAHGVSEGFFGSSVSHVTSCHAPATAYTHLDATRTEHEHPCIACASQHLNGLSRAGKTIPAPSVQATALASRPRAAKTFGQTAVVFRRGPPSDLSFC